ncbi:serine/threonine-protein kinase [Kitasatospora sp. A2-31]|uniref:serine/threonine-protein kinase n=1 Tax=Kitasatospora sp. A2-31 TaxID=2916414 RepID=UPI001EE8D106|nr:protein kinase [Kitasatospora sp. A2-31]MCG6493781.1 serine/threonine protein kinase [Kitasatospora sp. A2-31]
MGDGKQLDGRPVGGDGAPLGGTPEIEDERPWELPDYLHERELGAGASGRVVLARHRETGTPVAIKYLHGSVGSSGLREEAEVLAAVDSPHVTRLYEYVEGERGAAIVMELVDGIALRDLLRAEGATTPEAALVVLKGSLLGLAAAHEAGVVHRDYKPANVLVDTAGTSKLVDFGIAVARGEEGDVSGTPAYMPPEQWAGRPASPAGDVYAATVTFFECLTGARPYAGTTIAELAVQHTEAPIPAEQAPDPVRPLILAGLAKDPADRPDSAAALVEELEAVATAAYGPDWEEKGCLDLVALLALLAVLLPGAGGAGGGTALAHTALGGGGAVGAEAAAGTVLAAGVDAAAEAGTAPAAPVRETLVRRGARLGGRGKALAGVVAGTLTLATLAGMAMAGAADGGAHTVTGGAAPEATTTLGTTDPTGAPSPAASSATDTPSASPSASTGTPSASGSPSATATAGSPTAGPSGSSPVAGAPTTKGAPPATGAPAPGQPTPPPAGPASPPPTAQPAGPAAPTTVVAPTPVVTPTPTPTVAPATLAVSTVNLDSLTCSGRWSLSATVTVVAQGTGSGTLTLSWYHTSGGRSVTVATDTVVIQGGRATVTRAHDFGSADTFPTWGVRIGTSPAAAKPGRTSAETAAFLCDPPR